MLLIWGQSEIRGSIKQAHFSSRRLRIPIPALCLKQKQNKNKLATCALLWSIMKLLFLCLEMPRNMQLDCDWILSNIWQWKLLLNDRTKGTERLLHQTLSLVPLSVCSLLWWSNARKEAVNWNFKQQKKKDKKSFQFLYFYAYINALYWCVEILVLCQVTLSWLNTSLRC